AEMGLGLVLISHDMALVRKVTDRIVILEAGHVVEVGPSQLVSTTPRSLTGRRLVEAAPSFAPQPLNTEVDDLTNREESR
ncbi:MAG: methionine ABC transporter ATP-binding protein, partial [Acidimicrobiales bacterium]